jgi:hypothetical protein
VIRHLRIPDSCQKICYRICYHFVLVKMLINFFVNDTGLMVFPDIIHPLCLPAGFSYARDFSLQGHVAEHSPGHAEIPYIAPGAARKLAPVFQTHRRRISRQQVERPEIARSFQCGAFLSIPLHHCFPFSLSGFD